MIGLRITALLVSITLSCAELQAQRTTRVRVDAQVVDAAGKPVPDAQLADSWRSDEGAWRPGMILPPRDEVLRSDAEGRVRGVWTMAPFGEPLLALSPDRQQTALIWPSWSNEEGASVTGRIELQPAIRLTGAVRTVLGAMPVRVQVVASDGRLIGRFPCDAASFDLPLPSGTYSIGVSAGHGQAPRRTIVLTAGRSTADLGNVSVPLRPFDLIGELLPDWKVHRSKNIEPEAATLVKLRGKPLLIVFDSWESASMRVLREPLRKLAAHRRLEEFCVVLFDSRRGGALWELSDPWIQKTYPMIQAKKSARDLYGSDWAAVVLDAEGRLIHSGRALDAAVSALEALLR